MPREPSAEAVYTAAGRFVEEALRHDGSMFTPGRAIWSAENLNDLPGAHVTIERLCAQSGHAPANLAMALNQLADWHLQLAKDRDAAQRSLEKIIELLPETEMSLQAAQRIARPASRARPSSQPAFEASETVHSSSVLP